MDLSPVLLCVIRLIASTGTTFFVADNRPASIASATTAIFDPHPGGRA